MIDRVDAEAFDDPHPRHLLEILLVFGSGFLLIVFVINVEAGFQPTQLFRKTRPFGSHEVGKVVRAVFFWFREVEGYTHHCIQGCFSVPRVVFFGGIG